VAELEGAFDDGVKQRVKGMAKMPPIPPQNRSSKGVKSDAHERPRDEKPPRRDNFAEQGHQGNIKQNTTNQGYQQDR
jgi:hypothetical protein